MGDGHGSKSPVGEEVGFVRFAGQDALFAATDAVSHQGFRGFRKSRHVQRISAGDVQRN